MNMAELARIAHAMVAKGKGLLAADESTGTIKKRFDKIGVESRKTNRRDYRELLFRTSDAMKNCISGVILYDETIRQKAKDGTPLVKLIEESGAIPGIKVDLGAKPLALCPGETITEGLDGLRERLVEYRKLGARFAKWRAVIDIGPGIPTFTAISTNAHALARYAALCQEQTIVPIVEPEVLMDGDHDIDACAAVTEWVLKEVFYALFNQRVELEGMVLKPNMIVPGKKCAKQASVEEVAERTIKCLKACVPGGGAGHRVPLGRPIRRRCDRASERDEQAYRSSLAAHLLLWPRAAGGAAKGLERKARECAGGTARLRPSRAHERPRHARRVESRTGENRRREPALPALSDHAARIRTARVRRGPESGAGGGRRRFAPVATEKRRRRRNPPRGRTADADRASGGRCFHRQRPARSRRRASAPTACISGRRTRLTPKRARVWDGMRSSA